MYGPCFSAIVGGHPLRPPTRHRLGRPLPYQLPDGTRAPPKADCSFRQRLLNPLTTWGISSPFGLLSPSLGQVTHALLTRSPLRGLYCYKTSPFDLHVLGTPLAFILSQDQTLRKESPLPRRKLRSQGSTGFLASYHSSVVKVLSVSEAGCILLALPHPVKEFWGQNRRCFFSQHRLASSFHCRISLWVRRFPKLLEIRLCRQDRVSHLHPYYILSFGFVKGFLPLFCPLPFSVGALGFEPRTSCTPCKRASRAAPCPDSHLDYSHT